MEVGALQPYESALRTSGALALHVENGREITLDVGRWLAGVDIADQSVLARCTGPVLDVGCGPGRFVSALTARGVAALGVDIAETAVELTRRQGRFALRRSVFDVLPGEGRWPTVLLIDGNIGIGGDPRRLLARTAALSAVHGRVLVEAHPDRGRHELLRARFSEGGNPVGPSFDWAEVGSDALVGYAQATGYAVDESWAVGGRVFVSLVRRASRRSRTTRHE